MLEPEVEREGERAAGAGEEGAAYLSRQHALLRQMLQVTHRQRRYLVEGDLKGLDETNRLLGHLLERQSALHSEYAHLEGSLDCCAAELEQLRRLACRLQEESRTNYLLACRGVQFAQVAIAALGGEPGPSHSGDARSAAGLLDRPA